MNGTSLLTELRSNTGTTATSYSDTNALIDLNKNYHFIEDLVTQEAGENYFWNTITAPTVVGQSEYTLYSAISGNLDGQSKTLGVSIDYALATTPVFTKARKVDMNSLPYDSSWYETNQSTQDPIYTIVDNSIFIYPVPTVIGTLKQYVIQNLIDLTSSTAESDVFNGKIHKKYHHLIALGAEQYAYIRRQLKNEAVEAQNRFMKALLGDGIVPGMMDMINTRQRGAKIRQMPSGFEYKV